MANHAQLKLTTSTFALRSPRGEPQQSVNILLGFPRGTLANLRIEELPDGLPKPSVMVAKGNLVRLAWPTPAFPPNGKLGFSIQAESSLALIAASWLPKWIAPTAALLPGLADLLDHGSRKENLWMGRAIEPRKCCAEFFKEYDGRFLPSDIDNNPDMTAEQKQQRKSAVGNMIPILVGRRDQRATAARAGQTPDPATMPKPTTRDDVEHLSDGQLALMRECFSDGAGGIDYASLQECFERFANGELRNPAKPGEREPDGGFYFLFAEFAFLAVAMSVNGGEWSKLLRTFVKTQEIFMNTYRPPQAMPTLDDYGPDEFREPQQATPARKQQLRDIYDDLTPAQLEDRARSNMQRAQA
jgi:hypothetical protein